MLNFLPGGNQLRGENLKHERKKHMENIYVLSGIVGISGAVIALLLLCDKQFGRYLNKRSGIIERSNQSMLHGGEIIRVLREKEHNGIQ